eukprot:m51a1_g1652 hypothetical protein (103) ;mRNA; r:349134-349508
MSSELDDDFEAELRALMRGNNHRHSSHVVPERAPAPGPLQMLFGRSGEELCGDSGAQAVLVRPSPRCTGSLSPVETPYHVASSPDRLKYVRIVGGKNSAFRR